MNTNETVYIFSKQECDHFIQVGEPSSKSVFDNVFQKALTKFNALL